MVHGLCQIWQGNQSNSHETKITSSIRMNQVKKGKRGSIEEKSVTIRQPY